MQWCQAVFMPGKMSLRSLLQVDLTSMENKPSDSISEQWTRCGDVGLHMKHTNIIASDDWLDDLIISATQNLLKQLFPYIDRLLNPY